MSDFALTTDVQWAAYQRLWDIGTPVNDMLVSHHDSFGDLAGLCPYRVVEDSADLKGYETMGREFIVTNGGDKLRDWKLRTGLIRPPSRLRMSGPQSLVSSCLESGEGLGAALKSIGAQMAERILAALSALRCLAFRSWGHFSVSSEVSWLRAWSSSEEKYGAGSRVCSVDRPRER